MLTLSKLPSRTWKTLVKVQIYMKWNFSKGKHTYVAYMGWSTKKTLLDLFQTQLSAQKDKKNQMNSSSITPQLTAKLTLFPIDPVHHLHQCMKESIWPNRQHKIQLWLFQKLKIVIHDQSWHKPTPKMPPHQWNVKWKIPFERLLAYLSSIKTKLNIQS